MREREDKAIEKDFFSSLMTKLGKEAAEKLHFLSPSRAPFRLGVNFTNTLASSANVLGHAKMCHSISLTEPNSTSAPN